MFRRIRRFAASLAVIGLVAGTATPASADLDSIDPNSVPVVFDAIFLRPMGLAMTAVGAALFVPVGAVTLVVRHQDIDKPFEWLVKDPFTYTFLDPLGSHGSAR